MHRYLARGIVPLVMLQLVAAPALGDPGGQGKGNGNAHGYGFYENVAGGFSNIQGGPIPLAGATALGQAAAVAALAAAFFRRRRRA